MALSSWVRCALSHINRGDQGNTTLTEHTASTHLHVPASQHSPLARMLSLSHANPD